jgi:hypothetical protein
MKLNILSLSFVASGICVLVRRPSWTLLDSLKQSYSNTFMVHFYVWVFDPIGIYLSDKARI